MSNSFLRAAGALVLLGSAAVATAQEPGRKAATPSSAAEEYLQACVSLAEKKLLREAVVPARQSESLFRSELARNPRNVDALVGLARTLSQCVLPSANFVQQGQLSGEAMELLESALEVDPQNWLARFVLASINYRSPSFLRRSAAAAKHFDVLLEQQGDKTDRPVFARVFELRGMLYSRAGKTDSATALWKRGAALFPADSALANLAIKGASVPDSSSGKSPASPPGETKDPSPSTGSKTAGIAPMV